MLREGDRLDERAESPLGRLLLQGWLNAGNDEAPTTARRGEIVASEAATLRYDAGAMYAQVVGAYRSVIEAPKSTGGSGRGVECEELCIAAHRLLSAAQREEVHDGLFNVETCRCLGRKRRYDAAFEALMQIGQPAAKAVARVAVFGEAIAPSQLVNLINGLEALVRHFGLTPRRTRTHSRNAN